MRFVLIYEKAIDTEVLSHAIGSQTLCKACLSSKTYPCMHLPLGSLTGHSGTFQSIVEMTP